MNRRLVCTVNHTILYDDFQFTFTYSLRVFEKGERVLQPIHLKWEHFW